MNEEQLRVKAYMRRQRENHPHRFWSYDTISGHKRRGFDVRLRSSELEQLALNTPHCLWCGCQLNWTKNKGRVLPNSPTLDRRDNGKVVQIESVRIICHSCNLKKGTSTESGFIEYCRGVASKFPVLS